MRLTRLMRGFVVTCTIMVITMIFPGISFADIVQYEMVFRIDVDNSNYGNYNLQSCGANCFQTDPKVGNIYYGSFSFDNSQLINPQYVSGSTSFVAIKLSSFRLDIAGLVWDMSKPWTTPGGSAFAGFRYDANINFSKDTTWFEMDNGALTRWTGGVYGGADPPFVDTGGLLGVNSDFFQGSTTGWVPYGEWWFLTGQRRGDHVALPGPGTFHHPAFRLCSPGVGWLEMEKEVAPGAGFGAPF